MVQRSRWEPETRLGADGWNKRIQYSDAYILTTNPRDRVQADISCLDGDGNINKSGTADG
jgi:hypothetical protein